MRTLLTIALALGVGLGGYLFVQPSALQPTPRAARPTSVAALPAQSPRDTLPPAALPHATAPLHPALSGNPPRPGHRPRAVARQALLHLPTVLPDRTLSIPILMYHHVSSAPPATDLNRGLTVTDHDFAAQVLYLARHGYHTVTLRQAFGALYGHGRLPASPIVLSFDDGYADNYTDAFPILARAHVVGEFNIITAYPGTTLGVNSYMTWPQIRAMSAAGMEIGSHTVDHQDLGLLPEEHVRFELRDSRHLLQQQLGLPVQFLAYPDGQPFSTGSSAARQLLLTLLPQYGYVGALLDGPASSSLQHARTPYQLSRIRVAGGESLDSFAASLQP